MSTRLTTTDILFRQRMLQCQGLYKGNLDGLWGPKTDAAQQAFERLSAGIATAYGSFDAASERHIATLLLRAQAMARQCLTAIRSVAIDARIIAGTRSYAEQDALYKQGRYGNPGPRVTNARGGQSNHNFAIAWDIGIFEQGHYRGDSPLYDQAADVAVNSGITGLEWGGTWKSIVDKPHYQLATGLTVTEMRQRFEKGEAILPPL